MVYKVSFTTFALIGATTAFRTLDFVNYCNEPVWFAFSGGEATNVQISGTRCNSQADCPQGAICIQNGDASHCIWQNPTPANGDYKLEPGASNTVHLPYSTLIEDSYEIWNGTIAGRTGCDSNGMNCATADCGGASCTLNRGFNQPATLLELTMEKSMVDRYDISITNGVNIGMSINPTNQYNWGDDPYECTNPGSMYPRDRELGAATWNLQPPSDDYNWVTAGGAACASTSDCGGELCGYSVNSGQTPLLQKTCGSRLGFWSAEQICSIDQSLGAPFNCSTNWDLLACVDVNSGSCYGEFADPTCCGCVNWWEVTGITSPSTPYTNKCLSTNPAWNSTIQPMIQWLKEACPSCKTYKFDGISSDFFCGNWSTNIN